MTQERNAHQLAVWFAAGAALTFVIVIIGGITRLTQSGLSMVDWRPILGVVPPLSEAEWRDAFAAYQAYPEFQQLRPDMTMAEFRFIFFWEYLHRMAARVLGLAFLIPFAWFLARGVLTRRWFGRSLQLFVLGGGQAYLGWYMVQSGLIDLPHVSHYRLAAHLSLAFVIFASCSWFALDVWRRGVAPQGTGAAPERWALRSAGALSALLALQVVWGAFTAGMHAGVTFPTFPAMGGAWIPAGLLALEPWLTNLVSNPVTVQWIHRFLALLLVVATVSVFVRSVAKRDAARSHRFTATLLAAMAVQVALGAATVLSGVALGFAVAHQAVALLCVAILVAWLHVAAYPAPAARQAVPAGESR